MKSFIHLLVIIVGCIFFASCSSDIEFVDKSICVEKSPLLTKMTVFNDSLISTKTQTRSPRRNLQVLSIVCADVVGGYGGGKTAFGLTSFMGPHIQTVCTGIAAVITGGWASYQTGKQWGAWARTRAVAFHEKTEPLRLMSAYAPILQDDNLIEENSNKKIFLDLPFENKEINSIGPKHNIVLKNLQSNIEINKDCENYFTTDEITFLKSEEFIRANDSISNRITTLLDKGKIPETENKDISSLLINLFAQVLVQYPDNEYDVQFIINKYIDAVKNSKEIPENEKENIYSSFSIAASSYEYWTNIE